MSRQIEFTMFDTQEIFFVKRDIYYMGIDRTKKIIWLPHKHHLQVCEFSTYGNALESIKELPEGFANELFSIEKYLKKLPKKLPTNA